MWFWLLLAAVIVAAVCIWDYRRKAARREAVSSERFEQMFKAGTTAAATPAPVAAPPPAPGPAAAPEAPAAVAYSACERLLSQTETLIYYLLRSGIPDHEVFPKVPLTAVVGAPGAGYDREQQLRRLSRHQIDFILCDKAMRIVAAVQVETSGPEAVVAQRIKADCLKSAGIRLITIDPRSLPKRSELRALVTGQASASGAAQVPPRSV